MMMKKEKTRVTTEVTEHSRSSHCLRNPYGQRMEVAHLSLHLSHGLKFDANTPSDSGGNATGRFQQVPLPTLAGNL